MQKQVKFNQVQPYMKPQSQLYAFEKVVEQYVAGKNMVGRKYGGFSENPPY